MADTITIKSGALGSRGSMPRLAMDELGYRTDEKALYIGSNIVNVRLCGANDVTELNAKIEALNGRLNDITARLDALETPSE